MGPTEDETCFSDVDGRDDTLLPGYISAFSCRSAVAGGWFLALRSMSSCSQVRVVFSRGCVARTGLVHGGDGRVRGMPRATPECA